MWIRGPAVHKLEHVGGPRSLATVVLVAVGLSAGALTASASTSSSTTALRPNGIGTVRFGLPKDQAVPQLSALFGSPSWRSASDGCGPRYTEVEWGDLAAEFRLNVFSGYRYAPRRYLQHTVGAPRGPLPFVSPRLATATAITVGSTLGQLRSAYPVLHLSGADRWTAANGLHFLVNAAGNPAPPGSRIIEIKIGTCGDY